MKGILVVGNVFESKSLIVDHFCERDSEVAAKKLSSRVSGSAIVVSTIATYLGMDATLIAKAKSDRLDDFISKLETFGINTTRVDFSAEESNTLITVYDSHQDRKCYSYLPAQIQTEDIINIDYSLYDAVFFCCLPYTVVSPVFESNQTISETRSIILASGLTSEYFYQCRLRLSADYVFCNRSELFSIIGENQGDSKELLDSQISMLSKENATLVVTMGKDGVVVSHENSFRRIGVPEVKNIVHPGGAGDAFATGFINGVLNEMNVDQCCSLGHKCSEKMLSVYSVNEFIENVSKE